MNELMEAAEEYNGSCPFMELQSPETRKRRPQMFYTCAVALLTMANEIYGKAEQIHGPIGQLARLVASHAARIVYPILYHWLEILFFIDNQIIALQNATQTMFPSSTLFFNKLDNLINGFETLPSKFDDSVAHFSMMVHQSPTLNWAITHLIMGINFFISTVGHWDYDVKEREIVVDVNYNGPINETSVEEKPQDLERHDCIEKQKTIEKSTILDDKPSGKGKVVKKKKKKPPRACDIEDMMQVEAARTRILDALENTSNTDGSGNGESNNIWIHDNMPTQLNSFGSELKMKHSEKPKSIIRTTEEPTRWNGCGNEFKVNNSQNPILQLFETGWHVN